MSVSYPFFILFFAPSEYHLCIFDFTVAVAADNPIGPGFPVALPAVQEKGQ